MISCKEPNDIIRPDTILINSDAVFELDDIIRPPADLNSKIFKNEKAEEIVILSVIFRNIIETLFKNNKVILVNIQ